MPDYDKLPAVDLQQQLRVQLIFTIIIGHSNIVTEIVLQKVCCQNVQHCELKMHCDSNRLGHIMMSQPHCEVNDLECWLAGWLCRRRQDVLHHVFIASCCNIPYQTQTTAVCNTKQEWPTLLEIHISLAIFKEIYLSLAL